MLSKQERFLNSEIAIHVTSEEQQKKLVDYVQGCVDEFNGLDTDFNSYKEFPYFFLEFPVNGVSIELNASTGESYCGESFNLEIVEFDDFFKEDKDGEI